MLKFKKPHLIGLGAFGLVTLIFLLLLQKRHSQQDNSSLHQVQSEGCNANTQYPEEEVEQKDATMKGVIEPGQKYKVIRNWYRCNPSKRDEVVYYRYHTERPPVPRIIKGLPGDQFKLVRDKSGQAWNLLINGKPVTDATQKEPLSFGGQANPLLSLYENSMKGVLQPKTHIIFSAISHGTLDSSTLGVVHSDDFMGKVEPPAKP
ncbi:MAG: hypothetical protein ACO3A2_08940 [Bdellovibrionia bacterium]